MASTRSVIRKGHKGEVVFKLSVDDPESGYRRTD